MTGDTDLHPRSFSALKALRHFAASAFAVVALLSLAACGGPGPEPAATVTVWVEPSEEAESNEPAEVPTTGPTSSRPGIPVQLAAGHLRGAVRSYEQAREHFDDARGSKELAAFRSPSGNIYCQIGPDQAACEVREGRIEPPVGGLCGEDGADDVGRLEVSGGAVTPVCNTDSIRDSRAPKLAYGRIARLPGVDLTCLSEEWGVTCVDPRSEHGFFIARGSFATF